MRTRLLRHTLFKNEVLGVEDPVLTVLFMGLWCIADREGRLEDRPLRIKAEVFPYRNVDIHRELTVLERHGFIQRYKVGARALIQVTNFRRHQNPHHTEMKSKLPPIPLDQQRLTEHNSELTVNTPIDNVESRENTDTYTDTDSNTDKERASGKAEFVDKYGKKGVVVTEKPVDNSVSKPVDNHKNGTSHPTPAKMRPLDGMPQEFIRRGKRVGIEPEETESPHAFHLRIAAAEKAQKEQTDG